MGNMYIYIYYIRPYSQKSISNKWHIILKIESILQIETCNKLFVNAVIFDYVLRVGNEPFFQFPIQFGHGYEAFSASWQLLQPRPAASPLNYLWYLLRLCLYWLDFDHPSWYLPASRSLLTGSLPRAGWPHRISAVGVDQDPTLRLYEQDWTNHI